MSDACLDWRGAYASSSSSDSGAEEGDAEELSEAKGELQADFAAPATYGHVKPRRGHRAADSAGKLCQVALGPYQTAITALCPQEPAPGTAWQR